jgi:nucleoside-diphosphate-sugar epimerase
MHTILGAGGAIGNELGMELSRKGERVRFVGRNPQMANGATEVVAADLSNLQQTIDAVSGSAVAYLMVGLKYDLTVWRDLWPRIMHNAIEACKRVKAKLIFFDNVYMYGKVSGAMTENTPFNPCSKKGEIRSKIATMLLNEVQAGNLTALIARSADFYGPGARTSVPCILIFDKFAKGKKASWLVNDSARHSFSFTPDAGKSLVLLTENEKSWNQTWHMPTAPNPPTGREFIGMVAKEFGIQPKYSTLSPWMIKVAGIFDSTIREAHEMLYQSASDYIFDSTKFERAFNFKPTSYADGIRQTVYKSSISGTAEEESLM